MTDQVLGSEVPRARHPDLFRTVRPHNAENRSILYFQTIVRTPSGDCVAGILVCGISALASYQPSNQIGPSKQRSPSSRTTPDQKLAESISAKTCISLIRPATT